MPSKIWAQSVHGLAFAYMELGDIEQAQRHFQMVLDMPAPEELRGLAKNGRREMAARDLNARGPRKNGGLLSAGCTTAVSREVPA